MSMIALSKNAWQIAIIVAHKKIKYGQMLEDRPDILVPLKKAIFVAVREAIQEASETPPAGDATAS
jgi:hypothetical protein